MRQLSFKLLSCSLLFVSLHVNAAMSDINRIYKQIPVLDGFDICMGGGCAEVRHVSLSDEEWQSIASVFKSAGNISDAAQERRLIAMTIGAFETMIGSKTSTATDRAGTFGNSVYPGQLDCNDEAINTTTYMRLMRQNGLLKFHDIEDTRTRNFFFNGWPHSTAVIHETATGARFAVDSWFYDNGFPATIVPFTVWKSGYIPEDSPVLKK
jgi:hypothetical protein